MTSARAEWTGVGAALLLHVALIVALSASLARMDRVPEPPSMQVDIVDEVALEAVAPNVVPEPAGSPPMPPDEAVAEDVPEPAPVAPVTPPPPTPRAVPQPSVKPTPPRPPQKAATKPKPPANRAANKAAPKPAPRAGLGDDFLAKLDDDLAPRNGQARPAAPTYNATAKASIGNSIAAQAQRCANREPFIGEGADKIRLRVNLVFARSGRLARPPRILGMSGDPELRAKYGPLLEDQVRRIFTDCAPFRLPPDLYDTANGGWRDTTISYRVKT